MVKTGQPEIRDVAYAPPDEVPGLVEATTLATIRGRAAAQEFQGIQRVGFDLLIAVEEGTSGHRVDFTRHDLGPGDVLWVRTGQVQSWGDIAGLEGPLLLFSGHALPPGVRDGHPSHFPGAATPGSLVARSLGLLADVAGDRDLPTTARSAVLLDHVSALLRLLTAAEPAGDRVQELHRLFLAEVEQHFRTTRRVADYAARLGWSEKTLNRATRAATGRAAKEVVDARVVLEAKRLLAHLDGPVVAVAEELGFLDAANFSAYFRQRVGLTPAAFRSSVRT